MNVLNYYHLFYFVLFIFRQGFPGGRSDKESACSAGELGLIPGSGRSPGEAEGYPLQDSGLENFIDSIVHVVAKSRIQLSPFHFLFFQGLRVLFFFSSLEIRTGRAGAEKVKVLL